jgi:hypothetical protein
MIRHRVGALWISVVFLAAVALPLSNALAWGGRGGHREEVLVGHERYRYHDGRFYRPGWFGLEIALSAPPFGAVVSAIPSGYTTVIVGGEPYYCYNRVYYRRHFSGYIVVSEPMIVPQPVYVQQPVVVAPAVPAPAVVVPAPVIPPQPQQESGDALVINVANSNGSYTPVRLIKRYKGYEGPQGEYYPEHPTVEQLKVLYGK